MSEEYTFEETIETDSGAKKNNTVLIIVIIAAVLLLCCCCVAAGVGGYLLYQDGYVQSLPLLLAG
ncbi:MAG: hypothetical protein PVI59_00255 [Anaerolineae bacterium]|jgi:hypothetical protein